MPNFTVRDLSDSEHAAFVKLAHQRETSLSKLAADLVRIELEANDPQVCLGWIEIDRPGDIDLDSDCPTCDYKLNQLGSMFVALMADGSTYGPVCGLCATSE